MLVYVQGPDPGPDTDAGAGPGPDTGPGLSSGPGPGPDTGPGQTDQL